MNTKKIATSIIALAIFKEVISKNLLGITLILLCIFLTGCGDSASVGIVGEEDGTTAIIFEHYDGNFVKNGDAK